MELFEQHGFHPRTDLGQNFLIDLNIVEYIVEQARLNSDDVVLEVGAGTGGMTTFLAQQAAAVISVELDTKMYGLASEIVAPYENVILMQCDALQSKNTLSPQVMEVVQQQLDVDPARRLKLVSNLPYNVATPIVSNLVATDVAWDSIVVTIQLELAQRMASRPKRSNYGALSIWLQSQCYVRLMKRLPPTVFWPRPKVNSAIVRLHPNPERRARIVDREFLHDFVRRLFHQRRKYLRSTVVGMYRKELEKADVDAILVDLKLAENARAEELDVTRLVDLSNRLHAAIDGPLATESALG